MKQKRKLIEISHPENFKTRKFVPNKILRNA